MSLPLKRTVLLVAFATAIRVPCALYVGCFGRRAVLLVGKDGGNRSDPAATGDAPLGLTTTLVGRRT
jgi:hypothetical protein